MEKNISECIFCKIVKGEVPCHKVWEDEDFLVFVDVFPILRDQLLLIPKKHLGPYLFDLDDETYKKLMLTVKRVAKILDKSLSPIKTGILVEGLEVDHVHVKLFPFYNKEGFGLKALDPKPLEEDFKKLVEKIKKEM